MVARAPNVIGTGTLLWCTCKRDPITGKVRRDPHCIAEDREVLYDGPAGSSKTYSDLARIYWLMCTYPGVRILGLRRTLVSMRESIQISWETHILGADHEWLQKGGSIGTRSSYTNPTNGAHFAIGGTDEIEKHLSSEWDLVIFFEATQPGMIEYDWNTIGTRMRGTGIPHPHCAYPDGIYTDGRPITALLDTTTRFAARIAMPDGSVEIVPDGKTDEGRRAGQMKARRVGGRYLDDGEDDDGVPLFWRQRIAECNPSIVEGEQHWLYRRWHAGHMVRLLASHADNPRADAAYLAELRALPEPFRSVYYEGKWVSVEGKCWPTYNPELHYVLGQYEHDPLRGLSYVHVTDPKWRTGGKPKVLQVSSVIAGFDWGLAHPGSLQVFAVVGTGADKIAFRVAELLHGEGDDGVGSLDWWADQLVRMVDRFHIQAVLCDPSARAIWEMFNVRLGPRAGRNQGGICQAADNTHGSEGWLQGGIDLVRSLFAQNRLFLLADCHQGPLDPRLVHRRRPTGWHLEIPGYVLARDATNPDRVLPYPDKKRGMDDGCDAARYALVDIFSADRDLRPKPMRLPKTIDDMLEQEDARIEREATEAALRKRTRNW
jgi:hypothetical protein